MFCVKCGSPVDGEQELCSKCAAEQTAQAEEQVTQAEEQVTQTEETTENPMPTEEEFVLNSADTAEEQDPPKKKRGLIAAIVAALLVVACVAVVLLNLNSIKAFVGRTFQSPEDYYVNVEEAAIAEYSDELSASYGEFLDKYYDEEASVAYDAIEAEMSITLGDELLTLIESALAQSGMEMDAAWLQNVRLSLNANVQGSVMEMLLGASLGNNKLLTADVIMDTEGSKVYAAVPELNEDYVYFDVSDMMSAEEFQEAIAQGNQMSTKLMEALPSEKELNTLINTYTKLALACIKNVEKETVTVTVNGVSQKMVVLTATITETDMVTIAHNVLTKAQDDQVVEKLWNAISELYDVDTENLKQGFSDILEDALERLEEAKEQADDSNYVELKTYVDMENSVRGRELNVYTAGEKVSPPISWMTAVDDKTTYIEINLGEVSILGEKMQRRSKTEGFYQLYQNEQDLAKLEFEVVEDTSTTLCLIPGAALMRNLMSEEGLPAALMAGNVALELSYGTNKAGNSFCELNVLVGSNTLLNIGLSAQGVVGDDITVPTDAIDIVSADGVSQWLANADVDNFIDGLENANVPEALVDILRTYSAFLKFS